MTHDEINKLLTEEVFGECWHEGVHPLYKSVCNKCGKVFTQTMQWPPNTDFFTLEGCMQLWMKIQEMDWFAKFMFDADGDYNYPMLNLIRPDRLAPAVAEFLQERR